MCGSRHQTERSVASPSKFPLKQRCRLWFRAVSKAANAFTQERSQLKTTRAKHIATVAGALIASVIIGVWLVSDPAQDISSLPEPATVAAKTGDLKQIIIERGLLQPSLDRLVYSTFNGTVERMVEEGVLVNAGDPIIWFQTDDIDERIDTIRGNLDGDIASLQAQRRRLQVQIKLFDLSVERAEIQYRIAKLNLEKIRGRPDAMTTFDAVAWMRGSLFGIESVRAQADAQTDRRIAAVQADQASAAHQAAVELHSKGYIGGLSVQSKLLSSQRAAAALGLADTRLMVSRDGPTAAALRRAELYVNQSALDLKRERFLRESNIAIARREIELAQIEVDRSMRDLIGRIADKRKSIILAPINGRVAYVDIWRGSNDTLSPLQVGETRGMTSDLCRVADDSVMRVQTLINEIDAPKIAVGMPVTIELPALIGARNLPHIFPGIVGEIFPRALDRNRALGSQALSKSGEALIRVVEAYVDIRLDTLEPDVRETARSYLKRGMTAVVQFETPVLASGTIIPATALWQSKTSAMVVVKQPGGRFEPKRITVIKSTETEAVVEGLEPGAEIVNDIAVHNKRFKLND
ncbi:MAG: hypothetical protein ABIH86_07040 [Planctomycetota bacterium]